MVLRLRASRPGLVVLLTETPSRGSVDLPEVLPPGAVAISLATRMMAAIEAAWVEELLQVDRLLGRVTAVSGPTMPRAATATTAVNRTRAAMAATAALLLLLARLRPGTSLLELPPERSLTVLTQATLRWLLLQDSALLRHLLITSLP